MRFISMSGVIFARRRVNYSEEIEFFTFLFVSPEHPHSLEGEHIIEEEWVANRLHRLHG